MKTIKGVDEKGSGLQAGVMTVIAWNNRVGGSSRRFKGKLRHSEFHIMLIQTQELKGLFGFISFPRTRKNLELEHHQEVFIKFFCA